VTDDGNADDHVVLRRCADDRSESTRFSLHPHPPNQWTEGKRLVRSVLVCRGPVELNYTLCLNLVIKCLNLDFYQMFFEFGI